MNRIRAVLQGAASVLLASGALALLSPWYWWAELFSHFAFQYAVGGVVLVPLLVWRRSYFFALSVAAMTVWQVALLAPLYLPPPGKTPASGKTATSGQTVTFAQFNVMYTNTRMDDLVNWLRQGSMRHDVVLLQEVTHAFASRLWEIGYAYPYQLVVPRDDAYGYVVLSKYRFRSMNRRYAPDGITPYGEIELELPESRILHLFAVHTRAPVSDKAADARNRLLAHIGHEVRRSDAPYKIVIGDLNVTPFSPYFKALLTEAGLRNAAEGRGLLPTWPTQHRLSPLQIPIDHVLVTGGAVVAEYDVQEDAHGSDHKPVVAGIRFE